MKLRPCRIIHSCYADFGWGETSGRGDDARMGAKRLAPGQVYTVSVSLFHEASEGIALAFKQLIAYRSGIGTGYTDSMVWSDSTTVSAKNSGNFPSEKFENDNNAGGDSARAGIELFQSLYLAALQAH